MCVNIASYHPLHRHIFNHLSPCRGKITEEVLSTVAGNIAFIIRYAYGPGLDPNRISIPIIEVRDNEGRGISHRAAVIVHEDVGRDEGEKVKFTVLVEERVEWGQLVLEGLTRKVDRIVNEIME